MSRSSRWLIFLPVALFALFAPQPAQASQIGLLVRGYSVTEIPPTKSDIAYPLCGSSVEPFINATWDYEQNLFGDCGWDSFMLHYTGYIQIPEHDTIEFWVASDDGGTVKIGLEEFGVWQDQGCSATETGLIDIAAGTQPVDAWFYENGGGTCFMLAWNIDNTGWAIVQPEFFTSEPLTPETTSILETTTTESTTTSTTTTSPSTTTVEPQTTSTTPQTSSSIPPSTNAVTTTAAPQTITTFPETTSSVQTTFAPEISLLPPPTTEPPTIPTTDPIPTTAMPTETTLEQVTTVVIPSTTIAPEPTVSLPVVTNPPDTTLVTPSTFILSEASPDEPLTEADFVEALSVLDDATTPEQVQAVVEEILKADLSSDQAEQLVASAEVLTAITGEQAQQLFEQIEPAQLSESMAGVIADSMNNPDVPNEVKEAFEETLNIFGNDGFATYVPLGSSVNVAVRRTIIAGTTILVAMPSPAPARRT
jgi:hypothetical protein